MERQVVIVMPFDQLLSLTPGGLAAGAHRQGTIHFLD
jgi:hypothetical protein